MTREQFIPLPVIRGPVSPKTIINLNSFPYNHPPPGGWFFYALSFSQLPCFLPLINLFSSLTNFKLLLKKTISYAANFKGGLSHSYTAHEFLDD
jgi:hypothetical protein